MGLGLTRTSDGQSHLGLIDDRIIDDGGILISPLLQTLPQQEPPFTHMQVGGGF